jgi:ABC-type polysaccharide/polyol phosphate export permease
MSSGSAAFASPPPSAAPGITPGQPGAPTPPAGPPPGQQGYGPASYTAPSAPQPSAYGNPAQPPSPAGNPAYAVPPGPPYGTPPPPHGPGQQQPYSAPQPNHQQGGQPNPYGQPSQGQYGWPAQPPPAPSPPAHGQPDQQQQPSQPQPSQPQYGQTPPPPATAPPPNSAGQVPQAPYATKPEPDRDMPMAGASPIRRNLDDTAELPAFLDSARGEEPPTSGSRTPDTKPLKRKFPLTTGFTALMRHRHALSVLVRRDLAVKYQSTAMGYVWSLIEPLGLTLIYWFVFDVVFGGGRSIPNDEGTPQAGYLLFIVSGIFAYQWFSQAVNQGAGALGGQSALITVMKVPREVFPVSKVFARFAEYVVGFPIIIAVALFDGGTWGWNMLWLIPAILVQTMLLAGMTFILAAANVLYKDVQRFLGLFMRVLFYASAIIFPVTKVAEAKTMQDHPWLFDLFSTNPLIGIFAMHRAAFIPELGPNTFQLCVAIGFSAFLMFFGRWIFYRMEPRVLKAL